MKKKAKIIFSLMIAILLQTNNIAKACSFQTTISKVYPAITYFFDSGGIYMTDAYIPQSVFHTDSVGPYQHIGTLYFNGHLSVYTESYRGFIFLGGSYYKMYDSKAEAYYSGIISNASCTISQY